MSDVSEGPSSSFRDRAERLFAARQGDSLGLRQDPESRLLLAEAVFERYSESLEPALLHDWQAIIRQLEQEAMSTWSGELVRQIRMHRIMLNVVGKLLVRTGLQPLSNTSVNPT